MCGGCLEFQIVELDVENDGVRGSTRLGEVVGHVYVGLGEPRPYLGCINTNVRMY